jgi:tRNA(Ile)-lysidine synthetase-like protein
MNVRQQSNRYVIAVSGGVDSVVLLHLMAARPDVKLTVAHYDHGIRDDSDEDRKLVQQLARQYDLPFVYARGALGLNASEATARTARYGFLHDVRRASGARAIMTAHHQDDVLETAILNLLRGTGRRGLSSLRSTDTIVRPLLQVPKKELLRFARDNQLVWHEDSTNADERYLRNYVRLRLLPRFPDSERQKLLFFINNAAQNNALLARELAAYLHVQPALDTLNRHDFILLPHAAAREVMAEWLLLRTGAELNRRMLERLVIAAKTGKAGSKTDVNGQYWLEIGRETLALRRRER